LGFNGAMRNVATWIRAKDEKWFQPILARYPDVRLQDARSERISLQEMNGLLLTGGPDIAAEFLTQPVPDPSVLDQDVDPERDAWEFEAIKDALARGLPIFAICKGLQVLNVALGGTLKLDIKGHNLPEQKNHDIQPLRNDRGATHRFDLVNSSHHQAIDQLAEGCEIESWCATDDVIEQIRLRDHPFALAVQYHPERGQIYEALFDDFFSQVKDAAS
jgi:putative glutamine amidotransferase